jgi:hypothetical protein
VDRGGSVFACGETGIFDGGGERRRGSRLEALLGLRFGALHDAARDGTGWENPVLHNYLRIEAADSPVFAGIGHTAVIPMGGAFREIFPEAGVKTLATYIPPFPIYPPEFSWTAAPKTDKPVITEYGNRKGGAVIYAAWDLDAVYGRAALPDHGDLIANIVRYLLDGRTPIRVECDAYVDFKAYRQGDRLIIHLINGNHTGFAQGYAEKNIPVGPLRVKITLPGYKPAGARATEDGAELTMLRHAEGGCTLCLDRLAVHQLIIVE